MDKLPNQRTNPNHSQSTHRPRVPDAGANMHNATSRIQERIQEPAGLRSRHIQTSAPVVSSTSGRRGCHTLSANPVLRKLLHGPALSWLTKKTTQSQGAEGKERERTKTLRCRVFPLLGEQVSESSRAHLQQMSHKQCLVRVKVQQPQTATHALATVCVFNSTLVTTSSLQVSTNMPMVIMTD